MRIFSHRLHVYLDYVIGLCWMATPWMLGFADHLTASFAFVFLGAAVLICNLLTKYTLGLFRMVPFDVHMLFDFSVGALLVASPWIFAFASRVFAPHVIFGVLEIILVVLTKRPGPTVGAVQPAGKWLPLL